MHVLDCSHQMYKIKITSVKYNYQDVHEVAAAEETLPSSQVVHADEAVVEYLPASLS